MESLTNTGIFLVQTFFTIYIVILLIRILSPGLHGEYHNSIIQFILKITSPLIHPLRYIIPYHKGIDIAAVVVVLILEIIHIYLYTWFETDYWLDFGSVLIWMVGDLLHILIAILFWSIVAEAIFSWISTPHRTFHEMRAIVTNLARPVMSPLRRIIPTIHGVDISPIIALIVLKAIDIFIVYRIIEIGVELGLGTN